MNCQRPSEYEANGARDRRIALTPMATDDVSPWSVWWLVVGMFGAALIGLLARV